jgi:hypothetical protein
MAAMATSWRSFLGLWAEFHSEAEEYIELNDGRVLVLTAFGGQGKTSGLEVGHTKAEGASVSDIRDGKVTKLVLYMDQLRARRPRPRSGGRMRRRTVCGGSLEGRRRHAVTCSASCRREAARIRPVLAGLSGGPYATLAPTLPHVAGTVQMARVAAQALSQQVPA